MKTNPGALLISFENSDVCSRFIDHIFKMEDGKGITIHVDAEKEAERLKEIFKKLDQLYQPHDPSKPSSFAMLDSPQSLITHTQAAIKEALKK